jgi:hypothetical protein
MSVREESNIEDTQVHIRGSVHSLGDRVPRGVLRVATYDNAIEFSPGESGRRELAEWIASSHNPLTARVIANRACHWLIGAGLVRTTDNFGTTGEPPSHPELLDYLATDLIQNDWSIKFLVRKIVLSHTYRLGSQATQEQAAADPENRLLSHMNRRRLDAECLHDAMLVASESVSYALGGSTIRTDTTVDYGYQHEEGRRGVYLPAFRNSLPEILEVFDFADTSVVTGQRNVSTVAPQALYMMNHPFVERHARLAAQRLLAVQCVDEQQRIDIAFRSILGRPPTLAEARHVHSFLESATTTPEDTWTDAVQSLFGSIDFRYLY